MLLLQGQEIDIQSDQIMALTRNSISLNSKASYIDAKKNKKEGILKLETNEESFVLFVSIILECNFVTEHGL